MLKWLLMMRFLWPDSHCWCHCLGGCWEGTPSRPCWGCHSRCGIPGRCREGHCRCSRLGRCWGGVPGRSRDGIPGRCWKNVSWGIVWLEWCWCSGRLLSSRSSAWGGMICLFQGCFRPDMDSVVVSSVTCMCAAEPAERHFSELPDIYNDSDVSGTRRASVQFGNEVDELNLQCIDVDGLGEAPGLPVPEFRDPVIVSDFASEQGVGRPALGSWCRN